MIEVANELSARGYAVDVVVLKRVGEYESHLDSSIRIVDLDAWRMLFSLPKLVGYLRRERPRAVMATDEHTHLLLLAARFVACVKTRVILRVGNVYTELYARYTDQKHRIMLQMIKAWYRYADIIIANSKGVADDIRALTKIPEDRITVIYNPKDMRAIEEKLRQPSGHPWLDEKSLPIVITHGRLREQKNLGLLIHAFAGLPASVSARLVLVGSGREEERLKEEVRRRSLEDTVAFVGYAENPYAFLAKADVYVSASLWEGLSNSLVEAMACGLPIIASDCNAGPREVLAPETDYRARLSAGVEYAPYGILTAVNDETALTDALTALLSDATMRMAYADASRTRAKDFDAGPIITAYIEAMRV